MWAPAGVDGRRGYAMNPCSITKTPSPSSCRTPIRHPGAVRGYHPNPRLHQPHSQSNTLCRVRWDVGARRGGRAARLCHEPLFHHQASLSLAVYFYGTLPPAGLVRTRPAPGAASTLWRDRTWTTRTRTPSVPPASASACPPIRPRRSNRSGRATHSPSRGPAATTAHS